MTGFRRPIRRLYGVDSCLKVPLALSATPFCGRRTRRRWVLAQVLAVLLPVRVVVVRGFAAVHLAQVDAVLRLAVGILPLAVNGHGATFSAATFNAYQAP